MQGNTTKILVGILSLIIIGSGLFFWRLSNSSNKPLAPLEVPLSQTFSATQSANLSSDERVRNLELSLAGLISQLKSAPTNSTQNISTSTLESRVKLLETSVADLQSRVKVLELSKSTTTTTTTTSSKSSVFIPLGWSGTTTSADWTSFTSNEMSFNPSDYPGYTSITFGATIKTDSSGGRAYVRLFNKDDNSVVSNSEASTDSTVYTGATSGKFTLSGGRKTYYLQIKSTSNYQALVQDAWIIVNY